MYYLQKIEKLGKQSLSKNLSADVILTKEESQLAYHDINSQTIHL